MIDRVLFSSGPLDPSRLDEVELALGVRLPDDFRAFMLQHNGGRPKPSGFDITWQAGQAPADDWRTSSLALLYPVSVSSEENLLRMNQVTFAGRLPAHTVAIGSDAGGNVLLLSTDGPRKGKLLFWCKDHEAEAGTVPGFANVGFVADSFQDLIDRRLRKPR